MNNTNDLPSLIEALMPPDYVGTTNTRRITRESLIEGGWHETRKRGLFSKFNDTTKVGVYYSLSYGTSTLILSDFTKANLTVPNMTVINSLAIAFGLE